LTTFSVSAKAPPVFALTPSTVKSEKCPDALRYCHTVVPNPLTARILVNGFVYS
jgi:hypothetical protein